MMKTYKILAVMAGLILFSQALKAQDRMFLRRTVLVSVKEEKNQLLIRKFKRTEKVAKGPFRTNRKVAPKLSLELLDNKGIHLFSISNLAGLPDMNVGAEFNLGLIINI